MPNELEHDNVCNVQINSHIPPGLASNKHPFARFNRVIISTAHISNLVVFSCVRQNTE